MNKPLIRFNYQDEWDKMPISKCGDLKQGYPFDSKTYNKKGKYNIITISNVGGDRSIRLINECNKICQIPDNIQSHQILKDKDILISMTGNVGRVSLNIGENNLLNQRVDVFLPKEEMDSEFIFQRLSNQHFEKTMILSAQGAAQLNISNDNINDYEIFVPEKVEQKEIATFLSNIDLLIYEKNNELEKTMKYKDAMLYKMFPKKGSIVPEIRFKGFEGEWKTKIFENAFEKLGNNSIKRDLLNYKTGMVKNIHYGDVLIKFGFSVNPADIEVPYINKGEKISKNDKDYLKTGDVVFADTAEDTTAGKVTEIVNPNGVKTVAGLHTYPCRPLDKYAHGFLGIMLNTSLFHDQLIPYMQGTKVTGFNYGQLCKTEIYYPEIAEQIKIVNFFSNLDLRIQNQKKEITILENYKTTLLEKMFA